jgi:transcriptional regulator with PAS, ATPase and Fis domain
LKDNQGSSLECVKNHIIEDPNVAIMAIDNKCRLVFANNTYLRVTGFHRQDIMGRHIEDFNPLGRTPEVLRTGKPIKAYFMPLNGQNTIASSYPVIINGEVIGVIGRSLFLEINDAYNIAKMMDTLENDIRSFKIREQNHQRTSNDFLKIIGENASFRKVRSLAQAVAQTDSTILITGETGTGKDLFARGIHLFSSRGQEPFVRVNCAAIPEQLLESELFGYEEGTFTGALKGGKKGKFELANQGTIFLDEIGEMPLSMQSKLLVVLQEKEIEPLGSQMNRFKKIDVRIIAATNQKLEEMVEAGSFRQDLYYRLNVINLEIPPLRNRKNDIGLLSESILKRINQRMGTEIHDIDPEVYQVFMDYSWPGNIRELENVIERGIVRATIEGQDSIQTQHITELFRETVSYPFSSSENCQTTDLKNYLQTQEKFLLEEVLRQTNGEKYLASQMLNIHISALYKKMNKYGLMQKVYQ